MADITKIQPIGSSIQYELGARYLTTGRTISISDNDATNTGPASSAFNGTANLTVKLPSTIKANLTGNASTATKLASSSTTNTFWRGDNTWSSILGPEGATTEGGQLTLAAAPSSGYEANLDVYSQYFRIHSKGSERFKIDLSSSAITVGTIPWGNVTNKPSTFAPSSHTHAYLPLTVTNSCNVNNVSQGLYIVGASITGAPLSNHGVLLYISSVGTPFQIYMPDNLFYIYKRIYSGGAWSGWQIMTAAWA